MNHSLDFSRKSDDCIMSIIFGVSCFLGFVCLILAFFFLVLGYKDLKTRRETRESAWRSPGWDECVAYTVPLIREMHCRILIPTPFSPTQ